MDVVVTGAGAAPVLDLRREDFIVTEDGVVQEAPAFEAVTVRRFARRRRRASRLPEPRVSSNVRGARP